MVAHPSPPEPGKAPKYPFGEWLDGREWTIMRGRDYWCANFEMERRLLASANARRLNVRIRGSNDGRSITVQALARRGVA